MRILLSLIYVPFIYFSLKYFNTTVEDMLILKAFPLFISLFMTVLMLISYLKKNSIILRFAKFFLKEGITKEESAYIHSSTKFWILVSFINIIFHIIILFDNNSIFWLIYSSIGWYGLFIFAGLLQYLHRRFVFLKDINET